LNIFTTYEAFYQSLYQRFENSITLYKINEEAATKWQKSKFGPLFKKLLPVKVSSNPKYDFSEIDLRFLGLKTVLDEAYNLIIAGITRNSMVTAIPIICLIGPSGCGKVYFLFVHFSIFYIFQYFIDKYHI
jgi:hypothetical protein